MSEKKPESHKLTLLELKFFILQPTREAEIATRNAVSSSKKARRQCLLADALVYRGIALAPNKNWARKSALHEADEVAHAGNTLTKLESLGSLRLKK